MQVIEINLKNKPPFRSCISKINNTFINNAKDCDIVMILLLWYWYYYPWTLALIFWTTWRKLKKGFKRTISCNKYRSEITAQPKDRNLDYIIDPTFRNIN